MSIQLNPIIQVSLTEYKPYEPGGPNYIGAVDYPNTVYQGYIGSAGYIYEPRSIGYGIIDDSNARIPVAKSPSKDEFKDLDLRTTISPILGECSIPSFFQESEDIVRQCNLRYAQFIFKASLLFNLSVSIILYKKWSPLLMGVFVGFHILLYYVLTVFYVDIVIGEWKTFQKYKYYIKKDIDHSNSDSPLKQFNEITQYINQTAINRRTVLQMIFAGSLFFVWLPFFKQKE
jgi:hypothetical protein